MHVKKILSSSKFIATICVLLIASACMNIFQSREIGFWKSNTFQNFFQGYADIKLASTSNFNSATRLSFENQGVGIITQTVNGLRHIGIKGSSSLSQDLLIAANNPSNKTYSDFIGYFTKNFNGISTVPANQISISEFQKAMDNTISKAPKQ